MRLMKILYVSLPVYILLAFFPGQAEADVNANIKAELPYVWRIQTPDNNVRANASPYAKCAPPSYFTSNQASTTVNVTKADQFSLKVTKPANSYRRFAAALVHPNGSFICLNNEATKINLTPGRYPLYVFLNGSNSHDLLLHVDRPGEEAERLAAARKQGPMLEPTENGPNPLHQKVSSVTDKLRVSKLGLDCSPARRVDFVGQIKLPYGSQWSITNGNNSKQRGNLYLRNDDVQCSRAGGDLDAGTYDVFVPSFILKKQKELSLVVEDRDRDLWYGNAPTHEIGKLSEPQWIPLEAQSKAGAPDALLTIKSPNKGIWVSIVSLGESEPKLVRLDRKKLHYGPMSDEMIEPGKIAVFASDKRSKAQKNAPRWLLIRRPEQENTSIKSLLKLWGDPLVSPMVKGNLPLAHRELQYVFPYLPKIKSIHVSGRVSVDELFLRSPEHLLFLKRSSGSVQKGEPVLLYRYGKKRSTVIRATNQKVEVRTDRLSTTPIAGAMDWTWTFPESRVPTELHSYRDVIKADYYLPLSSRSKFAAWRDRSQKIGKCIQRFMRRNDPSYDQPYELVYVSSGQNVSDVVYRRARNNCGANRHDKMGERLIAKELANEKNRRKNLGKNLRKLVEKMME